MKIGESIRYYRKLNNMTAEDLAKIINKDRGTIYRYEKGYIEVDERKRTKIEGIYAIGDCTSTPLKQIITASSDGALAAVDAYKYVRTKKGKN